jgi:hypothetical protein
MGLTDFFRRLAGRNSDDVELERTEEETRMTPLEREFDQEDYEGKKDDAYFASRFPAGENRESGPPND